MRILISLPFYQNDNLEGANERLLSKIALSYEIASRYKLIAWYSIKNLMTIKNK